LSSGAAGPRKSPLSESDTVGNRRPRVKSGGEAVVVQFEISKPASYIRKTVPSPWIMFPGLVRREWRAIVTRFKSSDASASW
jgi:hypothetical protein